MSKTTTRYAFPYPEDSDTPNAPSQIKALADRLESILGLRGRIGSGGTVAAGTGFTVSKPGTGRYLVTFETEFSARPVVVATAEAVTSSLFTTIDEGPEGVKKQAQIRVFDAAGTLTDASVSFMAALAV